MITLANSSIDDELAPLPINLNSEKKDGKDTSTLLAHHTSPEKKQLMPFVVLEKRNDQCRDPKITGSGHLAPKPFRC